MGEEVIKPGDTVLRVRSSSNASKLASAIAHNVYDGKNVYLRAIGAGAVNQSIKAMAIAQSYVGARGVSLVFRPGFTTVTMTDRDVTGMLIRVIPQ